VKLAHLLVPPRQEPGRDRPSIAAAIQPSSPAASTYPDNAESRLDAFTQASSSMPRDCHRPSAKQAASWVFPHDRS
jgi:hypothetical protein